MPGATVRPLKMQATREFAQAVGAVELVLAFADGVEPGIFVCWFRGEPMFRPPCPLAS